MRLYKRELKSVVGIEEGGELNLSHSSKYCNFIVVDDYNKFLNLVRSHEVTTLEDGDKIFFPSFIQFSRQKIRSFLSERKKINIVRNINTSNLVVCSRSEVEVQFGEIRKRIAYVGKYGKNLVLSFTKDRDNFKQVYLFDDFLKEDVETIFQVFETIKNKRVISSDVLHNITTAENVIQYGDYKAICNLFDSPDKTMHDIAILTIFTSNLEKSLFYILLLIERYYYSHMRYNANINRINIQPVISSLTRKYSSNLNYRYSTDELEDAKDVLMRLSVFEDPIHIDRKYFNKIIKYIISKDMSGNSSILTYRVPDINPSFLKRIRYE